MPGVSGMTVNRMPLQPHLSLRVNSPTLSSLLPHIAYAHRK
ncbi:hypothetical protein LEMLEM_LOCUS22364 [Lemmus lemmus]